MLKLTVKISDVFNDDKQEFLSEEFELELEHSLISLSKWESEFEKPFLGYEEKTAEEVLGYVRAMIITPEYPPDIFDKLSKENLEQINGYIEAKMTATWFNEPKVTGRGRQQITSELIYYWIVSYQIPWEVETWHLNRLFTLIKVFNANNTKKKAKSPSEAAAERRALNDARRKQLNTSG